MGSVVLAGLSLVTHYCMWDHKHLPVGDLDREGVLIVKQSSILAQPYSHTCAFLVQHQVQEVPLSLPVPTAWASWAGCCVGSCCATAHRCLPQASPAKVPWGPWYLFPSISWISRVFPTFHVSPLARIFAAFFLDLLLLSKAACFREPSL